MNKRMRAITAFLGFFMLVPGTVKFFDPFKGYFTTQITQSGLPFQTLTYWTGQLGEIFVGLLLFMLVFFWNRLPSVFVEKVFYLSHLIVTVILLVSLYVHSHSDVPAHVLPMEQKFPYLSLLMLCLLGVNIHLFRKVATTRQDCFSARCTCSR